MNFKNTLLTTLAIMFSLILAAQEEEAAPEVDDLPFNRNLLR